MIGRDIRTLSYLDRFKMHCDSDSYPSVMAACGFVYRHMDRVLTMILRPPLTFIDVGANVGFVTLLACSNARSSEGRIDAHCFEPDPGVFNWLSNNQHINPDFEIVINPSAVGAKEGEGELTISARSGWSTMAQEPPGGFSFLPKAGKATVPVTTLDSYCREHKLSPAVIKIDVEGLEKEVLIGARTILEQSRPYLLIEINPLRLAAAGTSGEELILQLSDLRYRIFHIDPHYARSVHHAKRAKWRGLPEVVREDLVTGHDFDALAVPEELVVGQDQN